MSSNLELLQDTTARQDVKQRVARGRIDPAVGTVFGRWTVISASVVSLDGYRKLKVKCSCGVEKEIQRISLLSGSSKSCGCLSNELAVSRTRTHGKVGTAEYGAWKHLKDRCNNPRDPGYPLYGGRGIKVCPVWDNSFAEFYKAVGPKPFASASIDRVNCDKDYEPGNVRWASAEEQADNRRNCILYEYRGEKRSIKQLALISLVGIKTLKARICDLNWPVARAVETPVTPRSELNKLPRSITPATRHKLYPQP